MLFSCKKYFHYIFILFTCCMGLASCGQTGALYLPSNQTVNQPSEEETTKTVKEEDVKTKPL